MRYAVIREMDVVNAEGIACSVFFQGCLRHCPGCFNPETWDFDGGKEWTDEIADKFCYYLEHKEELAEIRRKGLKFADETSWEKEGDKIVAAIKKGIEEDEKNISSRW